MSINTDSISVVAFKNRFFDFFFFSSFLFFVSERERGGGEWMEGLKLGAMNERFFFLSFFFQFNEIRISLSYLKIQLAACMCNLINMKRRKYKTLILRP